MQSRIAFIGGGNMAQAMIQGLVNQDYDPGNIMVLDRHSEKLEDLHNAFRVQTTQDYQIAIDFAHVVILAVKPQGFNELKTSIKPLIEKRHPIVVSIMAGTLLETLSHAFRGVPIIRVMPNTPVGVNAGVCLLAHHQSSKEEHVATVKQMLARLGLVYACETEREFEQLAVLTGCGPAFVFHLVHAMSQAMQKIVPDAETLPLTIATFKGAVALMEASEDTPEALIAKVTSKGGLTAAGMNVLYDNALPELFKEMLAAALKRGDELAKS